MTATTIFTWPALATNAVSRLQTTAGAGSFLINGTLAQNTQGSGPYFVTFTGLSRTVSLTSAGNISAINFTIVGTYQGAVKTEVIAGPNANTVYTVGLFDSVTSITVSGIVATDTSIGSGTTGATRWLSVDPYRVPIALACQVAVSGGAGDITYTLETTLDDVATIAVPTTTSGTEMPNPNDPEAFTLAMSAATATDIACYNYPCLWARIKVSASANAGALVATFLQQGIK